MTDQDTHTPTTQETQIYDALTAGDHDAIADMREAAYTADPTPPTDKETGETPEGWIPPAEQYDLDYSYAWSHYQADHEAPEKAREVATKAEVADQNTMAAAASEGL